MKQGNVFSGALYDPRAAPHTESELAMHVRNITIANYKSFNESQTLDFEPGFNLILGGNNAGKSTVLEALDLAWRNEPHRSRITLPRFGDVARGSSRVDVGIRTSTLELGRIVGGGEFRLPLDGRGSTHDANAQIADAFSKDVPININFVLKPGGRSMEFQSESPIQGFITEGEMSTHLSVRVFQRDTGEYRADSVVQTNLGSLVPNLIARGLARIYRFGSQRRPSSECAMTSAHVLDREALTLPYFINQLQTSDAYGHQMLCGWVHRVLPAIAWVQSTPNGSNGFALQCLPEPPEARRPDLATPIGSMGTGIGNVVAMLYILLTAREPQIIAIDEPNAFLHPRALRELLAILESEGKQHQFLLTAHSADVLTAIDTSTISLLELKDSATVVKQASREKLHAIRGELARLGISVTDLHGKDRVLWVEGQTEELVFPELLRFACPEIAAGTAVLRVERTGTFEKKNGMSPDEIVSIYQRLSTSAGLVPPMICVLLDGEKKKSEEKARIEKESRNRLRFLDRSMLESYLLEPQAIHAALVELGCDCELDQVRGALSSVDLSDISRIDGAKVLHELFASISDAKEEFRKTRDVPILVSWLIANNPDFLAPLRELLQRLLLIDEVSHPA
ncbi:AAA family ATPase [Variovorax paradoxus]|nr:AAA family ATPase [Variovorax paradoxus]